MKKLAVLICSLCLVSSVYAAETAITKPGQKEIKKIEHKVPPSKEEMMKIRKEREAAFEQKLGLTEEQKLKARELRKQGHEKMHPIFEEIKSKKQEIEMVKRSRIAVQAQEERLAELNKELQELKKKADVIRKQNMKEFESILTKDQKKILKQMKEEGRKRFEEHQKAKGV